MPPELEVVIYEKVTKFIENRLQPKAQKRILKAIYSLSDPTNRRGSLKIEGLPANDPVFRIDKSNCRIFYKWLDGDVHAVDIEQRQGAYGKKKQKSRKRSKRR